MVTMEECTAHATPYMAAVTQSCRNAIMMYTFLHLSLTPEALVKVTFYPTVFTINGEADGLCFLWTIIAKAQLDTIGTFNTFRSLLGMLDVKIVELSVKNKLFHLQVNTITNALVLW
jgi:hypothetical protein